jgi:hypothetical protein
MSSTDVILTGPVFDGRAAEWSDKLVRDMQQTVADHALVEWESDLEAAIRHSTPVYQLFPRVEQRDYDVAVNDGWGVTNNLPYGPWLEGVGSRNSPVTRFPGYHALRTAFESVRGQVNDLCEPIRDEYVDRVNHE